MTIALAAVAGVHCSAPTYGTASSEANDEAMTEQPAAPATPVSGTHDDEPPTDDPRWNMDAEGLPPLLFTSSARGDDDAIYAAGTFAGSVTIGMDTVKSRGDDDVVLVRFEPDGRVAWVKAIGSRLKERSPKVTFVDGTVRILAETDGEVDCGNGKMGRWSSAMFFYCLYSTDGDAIGGGTFPTGAP